MQNSDPLIDELNPAQRDAVVANDAHLLVLAGAGSGKTRVLVHRMAWQIVHEGLSPFSLLAVTFTNKAAREMKGRLESLLSLPVNSMWVGTFHSIAHRLLRTHWQEAKLPQDFQILDSGDQLRLIKRVLRELELDDKRWPPRMAMGFINSCKDDGLRAKHVEPGWDPSRKTLVQIYAHYEAACEQNGQVDFNELLLRTLELLRDNPDLLAHYQRRFRHLLVDEFQDTNAIQYAWLTLLASGGSHVTVVGDDDQSIYGWRGAKIENIRHLGQDFPDLRTIRLEQNYRSTARILAAANAVIKNNDDRLGKELWTDGHEGDPIRIYEAFNEVDEARFIAARIALWQEQGGALVDAAVLYRSNAQARVLEEALIQMGIPYRVYGGHRFFERAEIKDTLSYLQLVRNPDMDLALERVINLPTRGIGNKTIEIIRDHAKTLNCSMWRAANDLVINQALPGRATTAIARFINLVNDLTQRCQPLSLSQQVEEVVHGSGLWQMHEKDKSEQGQNRIETLKELIQAASEFEPDEPIEGMDPLSEFLDQVALDAGDKDNNEKDAAQLMTLHSAKGLEFPLVFIAGMEETLFPHQMSMDNPDQLQEERRLCYVGITRAMQQLYLTHAESRRLYGENDTFRRRSRFLAEIPSDLVEEMRTRQGISWSPAPSRTLTQQTTDTGFRLGMRVTHPKFGDGTLIRLEGQGDNARLQINFDSAGSKWLVQQYAKVQPLPS